MTALLLALALAASPHLNPAPLGHTGGAAPITSSLVIDWDRFGAVMTEPVGTLAHVTWNGSAIVDSIGLAWSQQGTVPQSVAPSLFFGTGALAGMAGGFSDSNYYKLASASNALDQTGDFYECWVVRHDAAGVLDVLFDTKKASGSGGYYVAVNDTKARITFGGGDTLDSPGALIIGYNFFCVGRAGGAAIATANGETMGSTGISSAVGAGGVDGLLGRFKSTGNSASHTAVLEMLHVSSTPTDAVLKSHFARFANLLATKPSGQAITHTRADSTLCCPVSEASCYWLASGVPCVTSTGMEVYGASGNVLLQSQTFATSPWTAIHSGAETANPVLTPGITAPDGTLTAFQVDYSAINGSGHYSVLDQSIAGRATGAAALTFWARTVTGAGTLYGALSTNGTGSTSVGCSLTTTWARCVATTAVTGNTWYIDIGPDGGAGGQPTTQDALSVYLWGAQATPTAYKVPYRATAGAAYSGPSTIPSHAPAISDGSRFALQATVKVDWSVTGSIRSATHLGVSGVANSARVNLYAGSVYFAVYDATGKWKQTVCSYGSPSAGGHIVVGYAVNGALSAYFDGAKMTCSDSDNGGSGIITTIPAAVYEGSASSTEWNGTISQLKECRRLKASTGLCP